jgi:hypothetical protein
MSTPPEVPVPEPDPAPAAPAAKAPGPKDESKAEPKSFWVRTFSLTVGQALRLLFLSTLAGFFVLAFDYKPGGATFDAGGAFTAIVHRGLTAIGWALESFWKPALAGLIVVVPVWALWRLIRSPFRK